jgi:hypothetical protein
MACRERDGKSRAAEFVKVYRFMTEGMGLTGTSLLVYARIFGFCKDTGGSFWESRRGTAEFLGISERQVNRVIAGLESHGLIECLGEWRLPNGRITKRLLNDKLRTPPNVTLINLQPRTTA